MRGCGEQEKRQMFVLRRTKETTVKDRLTTKRDNIVFCKLSAYQEAAYKRFVVRVVLVLVHEMRAWVCPAA